jgi:ubiquinone/menaquinone biosynthesis C-methylase UbiE
MDHKQYIPALSFRWLTPLYDPILKWIMREEAFKQRLIGRTNIQPGMKVLDLGCGTGTLTVMLKRTYPRASITGLDADQQVLEMARKKGRGLNILWEAGFASSLPFPDLAFDCVTASLVIHHLVTDDKRRAFKEVHRVLKPNGELFTLDFGPPHSALQRLITEYMRRFEETADNFDGFIPQFISEAGFTTVKEVEHFNTVFGPLSLWQAVK